MNLIGTKRRAFIGSLVARRVTLVVAFGFLPQNSGRWCGPTNAILSFYGCRLSGGDTQTLPAVMKRGTFGTRVR